MNTFQTINTEYLRSSRTIETVLVSKENLNKIFFIYNYEGISFRVFKSHLDLLKFFLDNLESDFHFDSDEEIDQILASVEIL